MPYPTAGFPDLPAMPFGVASSREFTDEASCGEFLALLPESPSRFGAIGKPDGFRIRLKNVPLPDVSLVAGSGTPKATDHCSRRLALVIPFGGVETVLRCGNAEQQWAARPARGFDLDRLLEQIDAKLADRITLGDMETWSGLSARTIQLAFQKRFGIGPMQWVRDRRLDLMRAKLRAARPGDTVRGIAASCGLTRMASMIPDYSARFGERPGDTLLGGGR